MNLNKIFIGCRLTTDPELRQTPGGTNVSPSKVTFEDIPDDAKLPF